MGHPDRGDGLALEPEVIAMRLMPWSITLELRKTRTGWVVSVRVTFFK